MQPRIISLGILAVVLAACSAGGGTTNSVASAAPVAPTSNDATTSSATPASGQASPPASTPTAAAAASSGSEAGTCKFMSDADAATLLPNAAEAKVKFADTPAGSVTSCLWGEALGQANRMILLVNELKIDPAIEAAKGSINDMITQKIDGLGDAGGFIQNDSDAIGVALIKGKSTVVLTVFSAGADPNAVAAMAKKIAAGL